MKAKIIYKNLSIIITTFVLTFVISSVQFFSGHELAFSLFYIFPIILITWKTGIWSGIFMSFLSAVLWLIADVILPNVSLYNIILYLNNIFRLIVFLIITYIVSELKIALNKQKELARVDPLTSIANSRAFYEAADLEFEKSRRHGFPISVIYMDLDNFKKINDTLGHSTGDFLLKLAARTILKNIRSIDIVARLGGDEFAVLLAQTGVDAAYIVACKLREMILEAMNFNNWPVTTSIGIVTFLKAPGSADEMIRKADAVMYSAKSNGKNTIQHTVVPG